MHKTSKKKPWVIIVGAGPAGLLLGLLLARQHIPVKIVDQAAELDKQPRATHHGGSSIRELRRAGVLEDIRAKGFTPKSFCWRKLDGTYLAGLDSKLDGVHSDEVVCLPLNELGKILCEHLSRYSDAEILWNHRAVAIGQDENTAWVEVETAGRRETVQAYYVIGCDGANSVVRRELFGDAGFPGKTWEQQLVATNVRFLLFWGGVPCSHNRLTMTSQNLAGKMRTSLSTPNIGTWPLGFPTTAFGEFRMASPPVLQQNNYSRGRQKSFGLCFQVIQSQTSIESLISVHIVSTKGSHRL